MLPSHAVRRLDRIAMPGVSPRRHGRERGAVLVHVAVAMLGLLAFSALSIDLGTLWVTRAQAQNAVDAAALAGGVSLAYVSPDPDVARDAARAVAERHTIWGEAVGPGALSMDVGPCPAGAPAVAGECLRVGVARGGSVGTPLPTFFSNLLGIGASEVRASASAKVLLGNAAACPRPLAIPDRWIDDYDETPPRDGVWLDDDLYARYDNTGTPNILPPDVPDSYAAPGPSGPGSGITVADFRGIRVTRTLVNSTSGQPLRADQLIGLDLPRDGTYAEVVYRYEDNLASCSGLPLTIGATVRTVWPHRAHYTVRPLDTLIGSDPGAYWDDGSQSVRGSIFGVSPRLITIAVIDPDAFSAQNRSGGGDPDVVVRNLVGFFVEDVVEGPAGLQVRGVITPMAGTFDSAAPAMTEQAAFLRMVGLVR